MEVTLCLQYGVITPWQNDELGSIVSYIRVLAENRCGQSFLRNKNQFNLLQIFADCLSASGVLSVIVGRLKLSMLLVIAAGFGHSAACFAQQPALQLSNAKDYYQPLASHVSFHLDKSLARSLDDLLHKPDLFTPLESNRIGFGVIPSRIWLSAKLINTAAVPGTWRLDINRPYYRELDVYLIRDREEGAQRIFSHCQEDSFLARQIAERMLATDISLAAHQQASLMVSYRARSSSYMPLAIGAVEAVNKRRSADNTVNWVINGALVAIIAFALMLTAVIGWRLSTSFAMYIFAGTLFVVHADGYTFAYLWPNAMGLNAPLHLSFMLMMPIFGLLFARVLFNFKSLNSKFDRSILIYIVISCAVALSSGWLQHEQRIWLLAFYVVPIGSLLQLASGVIAARQRLLGWLPYLIGTVLVVSPFFYAVVSYLSPGQFNASAAVDFTHLSLLGECLAFAAAITIRLLGVRRERDEAIKKELASTRDRLKLTSDLRQAQDDYIRARKLSDMRRAQLSSVSHDLQQPLTSLRLALGNLGGADEDARQQMHSAFDYLESLAEEHLNKTSKDEGGLVVPQDTNLENFPVQVVLDNVYEMFKNEAAAKQLDFRYHPIAATVHSDPIALMRAVNNLVANAIKHTEAGGVLLAARVRNKQVLVQVWDTGVGLSSAQLEQLMQPYHKGEESLGHGLGLGIVKAISNDLGLGFQFRSRLGMGSVTTLAVPKAHQT